MPFVATIHNDALSGVQADLYEVGLFNGDPTGSGSEVSGGSYARQQPSWGTPSSGSMSDTMTFDVPGGATVDHIAIYDGANTPNMVGSQATDKSESWGSAGTASVTVTVNASG
jgi:hypothetical protein